MSYESFKQTLSAEKLEIFEAKLANDRNQYAKLCTLVQDVYADDNSRLPFIPAFYRTRTVEDEQRFLDNAIPLLESARTDEYCLSACQKQAPSCLKHCKQFASRAFNIGSNLFATLHKPYRFSSFEGEAQE